MKMKNFILFDLQIFLTAMYVFLLSEECYADTVLKYIGYGVLVLSVAGIGLYFIFKANAYDKLIKKLKVIQEQNESDESSN